MNFFLFLFGINKNKFIFILISNKYGDIEGTLNGSKTSDGIDPVYFLNIREFL